MPASQDPLSDSRQRKLDARYPQVEKVNRVVAFLQAPNHTQIASPCASRFISEGISPSHREFNLSQHQPAGSNSRCFGRKRRHTRSDQVGIDKISAVCVFWQEFSRKCGLSCTIRSRNNVDIRIHENSEAYLQACPVRKKGPPLGSGIEATELFYEFPTLNPAQPLAIPHDPNYLPVIT